MRAARHLIAEMELWKLCWQQVEAFVDRVEGARDQDAQAAAQFHALLTAAMAVERERALRVDDKPLGDPVIDAEPRPDLASGWSGAYRIWRLPGADEAELAVAQLYEEPGSGQDPVQLMPPREFYSYFVESTDPKFPQSDNGEVTVRMPAYPATATATIAGPAVAVTTSPISAGLLAPDIKEDGDKVSLFSPKRREDATLDIDQADDWVQTWTQLTVRRRSHRASAAEGEVKYYGAPGVSAPWSASLAQRGIVLCDDVIAGRATIGLSPHQAALDLAAAARGALAAASGNATLLRAAAETLDETGTRNAELPGLLRQTADALSPRPELFSPVAVAAETLAPMLVVPVGVPLAASVIAARTATAVSLRDSLTALSEALGAASLLLLATPPEFGPLGAELDECLGTRIAYPDGSLRILRALEQSFVRFWPARIRWFTVSNRQRLGLAMARFRAPFLSGLRALLKGGDTGFPVEGLTVLTPAATRGSKLRLDHPASFVHAMADVEAGHMLLTTRGRMTAITVLGVTADQGRLAFDTAPLRVSVEPSEAAGATDTPGLITAGQALDSYVAGAGLATQALRDGEDPTDPARDGLVEAAVSLYGQLALVFGWQELERALSSAPPSYAGRSLPDPSGTPLESLGFHGTVAANTLTLVLKDLAAPFLDRSDPSEPRPRIARPGEHLLIRGRGRGEEGGPPGPIRQAVMLVSACYVIPAQTFRQMDKTAIGLLSTTPLPAADLDTCLAQCMPGDPLVVLVLERSWQTFELISDITLRRDFPGFDLPSLAAGTLMPESVISTITGAAPPGPAGVERGAEFKAARGYLEDWTRFARR